MATIASLIVNIAADVSNLNRNVEQVQGQLDRIGTTANKVGQMLGVAFTIEGVIGAAKQVGEFGGRITDLSNKLQISVEQVQRLSFAAQQNGVEIGGLSVALTQMSKRLVEGEDSTVSALAKLNLNIDLLRRLSPDQAFMMIARAIAEVPDPMQQSAYAMALLGRSGSDLVPMFKSLREDMDRAVVASSAIISAADEMGDTFDSLQGKGTGVLAYFLLPLAKSLGAIDYAIGKVVSGFSLLSDMVGNSRLNEAAVAAEKFAKAQFDTAQASEDARRALQPVALTWEQAERAADALDRQIHKNTQSLTAHGVSAKFTTAELRRMHQQIEAYDASARHVEAFYAVVGQDILLQQATKHVAEFELPFKALQSTIPQTISYVGKYMATWSEMSVSVSATAEEMAAHTTSALGSIVSGFQNSLNDLWKGMSGGKGFAGLMSNLGDSIVKGFGNILSGGLNTVINMAVNLAVSGVAKIGGLIAGLFKSEETKKVNKPRDAFFAQFGGYEGLAKDLTSAFVELGNTEAGSAADNLIRLLYDADTESKFKSAQGSIADIFSQVGRPIQMMAAGGSGRVFGPTLFMAGEAGAEDYMFSGGNRSFGSGDSSRVVSAIEALGRKLDKRDAVLPIQLRAAMQLGMA